MSTTAPTALDEDGIPIHPGPSVSECCHVYAGQPHALSCSHVTPEQVRVLLARQVAS